MSWKLQLVVAVLVLMLLGLQYRLWVGDGSTRSTTSNHSSQRIVNRVSP